MTEHTSRIPNPSRKHAGFKPVITVPITGFDAWSSLSFVASRLASGKGQANGDDNG